MECLVSPIVHVVSRLRIAMEELKSARFYVQRKVDEATEMNPYKRKELIKEIAGWLESVKIIEAEVDEILQQAEQEIKKGRCLGLGGCCFKNYKFRKLVSEKMASVDELIRKGDFEEVVYKVGLSQQSSSLGTDGSLTQKEVSNEVHKNSMLEKVMRILGEEDEVRIMGLYGQGGVGKTTLLKQINNEFLKTTTTHGFDVVISVVVSKEINVESIQKEIGKRLGLGLSSSSSPPDKTSIFNALAKKNFVLLLDDIWERVDLEKIGIPRPQNKSKIIFTTRSETVCGLMDVNKKIRVECLRWDEAWTLFKNTVGMEALNCHPKVHELAVDVAKECGGLPLALITIGRAMSTKRTLQEWNHAITTLREFTSRLPGIYDQFWPLLKLSYDNLHSETIKSCFLYCSLYPEGHYIPKTQLIDFLIGEGILNEFDDIDEARNHGYDIIESLKGALLLESGEDEETSVKMHDIIRDLALWIVNEFGSTRDKFFVERVIGTPNMFVSWENAEKIYLSVHVDTEKQEESQYNNIQIETPRSCPNLLTLIVQGNSYYANLFLPRNIFRFMPHLRVLDLSELEIEEFPPSITELVELQYLGLSKTNIEELPNELRKLVKLKYLDLSHTYFLRRIPLGVIASLPELRVFNQHHSDFGAWESDDDAPSLTELDKLDELGITIETDLALRGLLRYQKFRMCTRRLTIKECRNLISLTLSSSATTIAFALGKLKRLKELTCQNCLDLKLLTMNWEAVEEEDGQNGLLSNLETLTLWNLPKLNVVWESDKHIPQQYVSSSFQNLNEISIIGCDALKDLTWLVYVKNLKKLYLWKCKRIREIIDVDSYDGGADEMLLRNIVFKSLSNIYLKNLPKLKSICKHALAFPSLESMVVEDCPGLKKLPLNCGSNISNSLQRIEGGLIWWNQLEWEDATDKSKFLPYFEAHNN